MSAPTPQKPKRWPIVLAILGALLLIGSLTDSDSTSSDPGPVVTVDTDRVDPAPLPDPAPDTGDSDLDAWRRADCEAAARELETTNTNGPALIDPSQHQRFVDTCVREYERQGVVP